MYQNQGFYHQPQQQQFGNFQSNTKAYHTGGQQQQGYQSNPASFQGQGQQNFNSFGGGYTSNGFNTAAQSNIPRPQELVQVAHLALQHAGKRSIAAGSNMINQAAMTIASNFNNQQVQQMVALLVGSLHRSVYENNNSIEAASQMYGDMYFNGLCGWYVHNTQGLSNAIPREVLVNIQNYIDTYNAEATVSHAYLERIRLSEAGVAQQQGGYNSNMGDLSQFGAVKDAGAELDLNTMADPRAPYAAPVGNMRLSGAYLADGSVMSTVELMEALRDGSFNDPTQAQQPQQQYHQPNAWQQSQQQYQQPEPEVQTQPSYEHSVWNLDDEGPLINDYDQAQTRPRTEEPFSSPFSLNNYDGESDNTFGNSSTTRGNGYPGDEELDFVDPFDQLDHTDYFPPIDKPTQPVQAAPAYNSQAAPQAEGINIMKKDVKFFDEMSEGERLNARRANRRKAAPVYIVNRSRPKAIIVTDDNGKLRHEGTVTVEDTEMNYEDHKHAIAQNSDTFVSGGGVFGDLDQGFLEADNVLTQIDLLSEEKTLANLAEELQNSIDAKEGSTPLEQFDELDAVTIEEVQMANNNDYSASVFGALSPVLAETNVDIETLVVNYNAAKVSYFAVKGEALDKLNTVLRAKTATHIVTKVQAFFEGSSIPERELARLRDQVSALVERNLQVEFDPEWTSTNFLDDLDDIREAVLEEGFENGPAIIDAIYADSVRKVFSTMNINNAKKHGELLTDQMPEDEKSYLITSFENVTLVPFHYSALPVAFEGKVGVLSREDEFVQPMIEFLDKLMNNPNALPVTEHLLVTKDNVVLRFFRTIDGKDICVARG